MGQMMGSARGAAPRALAQERVDDLQNKLASVICNAELMLDMVDGEARVRVEALLRSAWNASHLAGALGGGRASYGPGCGPSWRPSRHRGQPHPPSRGATLPAPLSAAPPVQRPLSLWERDRVRAWPVTITPAPSVPPLLSLWEKVG
jgi:hypothetical protein